MKLIPMPKTIIGGDSLNTYSASIICPAKYDNALQTFLEFADKLYEISFNVGESGGILVLENKDLKEDEYELQVNETVKIFVSSEQGLHYAFATLLQLLEKGERLTIPNISVKDVPESTHRCVMIDLARKFHPTKYLFYYIDMCYLYKLNRFQLHFTDDQGFTFPSKTFPKLMPGEEFYTVEELTELVEYANKRGVMLIPEMDIPGHCKKMQDAYPEIFGSIGVLPPTKSVFEGLNVLYGEMCDLFPNSPYIHIGGDEAAVSNWETCPKTKAFMAENNISDIQELYTEFIRVTTEIIFSHKRTPIVWEGFHKEWNNKISKNVIVISWENYYQPVNYLVDSGFTLINASWKPLYIVTPNTHWTPEEILNHERWSWRHWWENSKAYPDGIDIAEDYPVIGSQLCAWGDVLQTYEDAEKAASEEFELVRQRVPALAEKTWNIYNRRAIEDFMLAYEKTNSLLERVK